MDFHIQNIYEEKESIKPVPTFVQPENRQSIPSSVQQKQQKIEKQSQENNKKITNYDKILSSLNMQVVDGKLQIVRKVDESLLEQNKKKVSFQNQSHTQNPIIQKHTPQQLNQQILQQQRIQANSQKLTPQQQQQMLRQRQMLQQHQLFQQQQQQQQLQQQQQQQQQPQQQQQQQQDEYPDKEEIPVFEENPNIATITRKQLINRALALQYLKNLQEKKKIERLKPRGMGFW